MTFISYPDITATSPNGQFRIDIRGTPAEGFRDQSNFVYRLYRSEQLVWQWAAAGDNADALDDCPHDAWVNDSGWVVVRARHWFSAGLLVLTPDGEVALRRNHRRLLDEGEPGFLEDEPDKYMGNSSAGPLWARGSMAYFHEHEGRPFWTIRAWWGRRVTIDLTRAAFVEPVDINDDRARRLEIAHIQGIFAARLDELETRDVQPRCDGESVRDFWSFVRPIRAAAYHCGWLQSHDSVAYLRRLESLTTVGMIYFPTGPWAAVHVLPFRHVAKTSLLRMSQQPAWLSHYQFEVRAKRADYAESHTAFFDFPMQVANRSPEMLETGLSQLEVLHQVGAPDFAEGNRWEFDFLSPESELTVCVFWDESHGDHLPFEERKEWLIANPHRIERVEIVEPQWRCITERDRYLI